MMNWSQPDCRNRVSDFRQGRAPQMVMQFHSLALPQAAPQAALGTASSLLASWKRLLSSASLLLSRMPESTTTLNLVLGLSIVLIWSAQANAAMPPADEPATTRLSRLASPYLESRYLRWDRVMVAPLKYSCVSLYLRGALVLPWWKAPSQYTMITLVQFAKMFLVGSVDSMPSVLRVAGQQSELPRKVRLRRQQSSTLSASVLPEQTPPPWKQSSMLVDEPWWMQSAAGEPSRQRASGSVLWTTLLQVCACAARSKSARRERWIWVGMKYSVEYQK